MKPLVFEKADHFYLVAPVAPFAPSEHDVDELAFADELKRMAPNENLGWLRGQYVEAERPNANGQFWASRELEIAALTPTLMPVTVMHDPRTAVGMIADAKILAAAPPAVPRARIDTTLGIWRHRFPDVWAEVEENYRQGALMQSMECRPGYYDCGECGQRFPVLPGHAEVKNWCAHLRAGETAANARPIRRLGAVTFTGTGLIYGTRGTRGALDTAHLEVFQEEVAEFHERAQRDSHTTTRRRERRMDTIEIQRTEYDSLKAAAAKTGDLEKRIADLEQTAAKVPELERNAEKLEVDKKKAEDDLADEKAKREGLEEQARAATMAGDRTSQLGDKFLSKLPDSIKTRLVDEQAKKLSDDDWRARLDELAELTGVKPDEKSEGGGGGGAGGNGSGTFNRDELAGAGMGGGGNGGDGGAPSPAARRSVIGNLAKITAPK